MNEKKYTLTDAQRELLEKINAYLTLYGNGEYRQKKLTLPTTWSLYNVYQTIDMVLQYGVYNDSEKEELNGLRDVYITNFYKGN